MVVMIEEADAIAEECERAFQSDPSSDAPAAPFSSESESVPLDYKFLFYSYCHTHLVSSGTEAVLVLFLGKNFDEYIASKIEGEAVFSTLSLNPATCCNVEPIRVTEENPSSSFRLRR